MTSDKPAKSVDRFIQTSGFFFFLFGVLAVVLRMIQFLVLGDPPLELLVLDQRFLFFQGIPSLLAAVFFISGATALFLYQADQMGSMGLVIYFFAFTLLVISSGAMWTYAFTAPVLARSAPQLLTSADSGIIRAVLISMSLGQIGWLLLLLISLRIGKLPRWALLVSILSICGVVVLTPFTRTQTIRFIYNLLLGVGPLVIGYVLWRTKPK